MSGYMLKEYPKGVIKMKVIVPVKAEEIEL